MTLVCLIRKSFILFTGIGRVLEKRLWSEGAYDWQALPSVVHSRMRERLELELVAAEENFALKNTSYFYDKLPRSERWRLLESFSDDVAFLDVELDGWSTYSRPTIVGIYRSGQFFSLVRGINLSRQTMADALGGVGVIVTYNGRRHDMHFLGSLMPPELQQTRVIDMRHIARMAGFSGGLKSLERQTGVVRSRYVELAGTGQAVRLWKMWRMSGSKGPLELLRAYNKEDTCNLHPIGLRLGNILEERTVGNVI